MCVDTGPNRDIAIKLIKRLKGIFEPKVRITFANKETIVELNTCTIEAFQSIVWIHSEPCILQNLLC